HYYGHTDDLDRRVVEHNSGRSGYTRDRGPWQLLAWKAFQTRAEAMRFEALLKRARNKAYALKLIQA
ncbi:MAG TPA: GIY-YIG nuclease family protein, partial [Flavobacteriales bacterium]|nr:GIY-YIG nuclease family protein [Flavobacteriales bacterium]